MLGVGIDWAEQFHLVALGRIETGVFEVTRVEHTPTAVTTLLNRIVGLEPDPGEVRWSSRPATGCWWNSCWTPGSRWSR